jgi:hypothetical protein
MQLTLVARGKGGEAGWQVQEDWKYTVYRVEQGIKTVMVKGIGRGGQVRDIKADTTWTAHRMGAEVAVAVDESLNEDDELKTSDAQGRVQQFRVEEGWMYEIKGRPREPTPRVTELRREKIDQPEEYVVRPERRKGKEVGVEVRTSGGAYKGMTAQKHWTRERLGERMAEQLGWTAGEWEVEAMDEVGRRQPCMVHEHWRYALGHKRVNIRCKQGEQIKELRMDPDIPQEKIEEELTRAMGATKRRRQLRVWDAEGQRQPPENVAFREGWDYELAEEEYITDSTPEISAEESQMSQRTTRMWFRNEVITMRDDPRWSDEERHKQYRTELEIPDEEQTRLERRDVRAQSDKEPEWALIDEEKDTVEAVVHFGGHAERMALGKEWTEAQVIDVLSRERQLDAARPKELDVSVEGYAAEFGISEDREYWLKYRTETRTEPPTRTNAETNEALMEWMNAPVAMRASMVRVWVTYGKEGGRRTVPEEVTADTTEVQMARRIDAETHMEGDWRVRTTDTEGREQKFAIRESWQYGAERRQSHAEREKAEMQRE